MRRAGEVLRAISMRGSFYSNVTSAYFFSGGAACFATRTTGKYPVRTVSLPLPLPSAVTCTRRKP